MDCFALAPFPGEDFPTVVEVVVGETGGMRAVPLLSQRGIWGSDIARTLALLPLAVDLGARSWRFVDRPRAATRRLRDMWRQDCADFAPFALIDATLIRLSGPFTLAAAVELGNGHRALSDSRAVRDIFAAYVEMLKELGQQFPGVQVVVSEPAFGAVRAGKVPGTNQFEQMRAWPETEMGAAYAPVAEVADAWLYCPRDPAPAAVAVQGGFRGAVCAPERQQAAADKDAWGEAVERGLAAGYVIDPRAQDREQAIALAHFYDELQLGRQLLTQATVSTERVPETLAQAARDLGQVARVQQMLRRDAGDL